MRTLQEYLSGEADEELRVLVAEARGWKRSQQPDQGEVYWRNGEWQFRGGLPSFSTSLDSCRELLADLTEDESAQLDWHLDQIMLQCKPVLYQYMATARQICVAYLIVKGVLK